MAVLLYNLLHGCTNDLHALPHSQATSMASSQPAWHYLLHGQPHDIHDLPVNPGQDWSLRSLGLRPDFQGSSPRQPKSLYAPQITTTSSTISYSAKPPISMLSHISKLSWQPAWYYLLHGQTHYLHDLLINPGQNWPLGSLGLRSDFLGSSPEQPKSL